MVSVARAIISGRSTPRASRSSKNAFDILGCVFADGYSGGGCVADDFVVHVRDVHDVAKRHPCELQKAAQNVYLEKSPEVADMPVVVNRGPARVHAEFFPIHRGKFVNLSRKGVEQAHRHWCGGQETHISGQNRGQLVLTIVAVGITGGIPVTFVARTVTGVRRILA